MSVYIMSVSVAVTTATISSNSTSPANMVIPQLLVQTKLEAGVHRIPRALAHTFVQKKKKKKSGI